MIGLAFGYGLDDNVLASYQFIVENHREGDDIYLFGFSRGAYTVRVLAALIHKIGLISLPQNNLAGSGLTAYKQFSTDHVAPRPEGRPGGAVCAHPQREMADDQIRRGLGHRGQRDRAALGPDQSVQASVQPVEHGGAGLRPGKSLDRDLPAGDLDRRAAPHVPAAAVGQAGKFRPHRYAPESSWTDQDSVQVWFAGVHSDIGGGYPERQSALSKYPLLWMIEEAVKHGLKVDRRTVNQLGWGRKRKGSPFDYVAPDFLPYPDNPDSAAWQPHDSMNAGWRVLEVICRRRTSTRNGRSGNRCSATTSRVASRG